MVNKKATDNLIVEVLANHAPVIKTLTAEPKRVEEGTSSKLTCIASDADGDDLKYDMEGKQGQF
ncbi:hypothetical protein ACFLXC_01305 [Chloroflexota bacterium]